MNNYFRIFSILSLVLIGLVSGNCKKAIIVSGGGIRASIGTIVALEELEIKKQISNYDYLIGLSGGTWGITSVYLAKHPPITAFKTFYDGCKDSKVRSLLMNTKGFELKMSEDGYWGDFTTFTQKCCNGFQCYAQWRNEIDNHFIKPFNGHNSLKDLRKVGYPKPIFVTDLCYDNFGKISDKLSHYQLCATMTNTLKCYDIKKPEDVITYNIDDVHGVINLSKGLKSHLKNVDLFEFKLLDWLSVSSSAYLEGAREGPSYIPSKALSFNPLDIFASRITENKNEDKIDWVSMCDSGVLCNMPISAAIVFKDVDEILAFDYTNYGSGDNIYSETLKCITYWIEVYGWKVREKDCSNINNDLENSNINLKLDEMDKESEKTKNNRLRKSGLSIVHDLRKIKNEINLNKNLSNYPKCFKVQANNRDINLKIIPFVGGTLKHNLADKFPTVEGPDIKSYTCEELKLLKVQLESFYNIVV